MYPSEREALGVLTQIEEKVMCRGGREIFKDAGLEDWSDVVTNQGMMVKEAK